MEEFLTTLALSQSILVESTTGIPSMQNLKYSTVMCSTQTLSDKKSLEKVISSTLFCLLLYQIKRAQFKKMVNPVWPRRVTLLDACEASTYIFVIHFTPNFVQQSPVFYTILISPRVYYSIIKTKEKRGSLWEILKNPVPPNGPKSDKRVVTVWQQAGKDHFMHNKIVCLNKNMHCYSHYQVQGVYAQPQPKDMSLKSG